MRADGGMAIAPDGEWISLLAQGTLSIHSARTGAVCWACPIAQGQATVSEFAWDAAAAHLGLVLSDERLVVLDCWAAPRAWAGRSLDDLTQAMAGTDPAVVARAVEGCVAWAAEAVPTLQERAAQAAPDLALRLLYVLEWRARRGDAAAGAALQALAQGHPGVASAAAAAAQARVVRALSAPPPATSPAAPRPIAPAAGF